MEAPARPGSREYTYIQVLLVEDNPGDAMLVEERLSEAHQARFRFETVASLDRAIRRLEEGPVDVILLDLGLPDSHGIATLREVLDVAPETPIVVLTGFEDQETAVHAVRMGAQDYLVKGPIDAKLLTRSILYAIERKRVLTQLHRSEDRFRKLVEKVDDAIVILDEEGIVQFVNPAAESLLGPSGERLVGSSIDLPPVRDGTTEVPIVDGDGHRTLTQVRVTGIEWAGRDSYLLTVTPPGTEDVRVDERWSPGPVEDLR